MLWAWAVQPDCSTDLGFFLPHQVHKVLFSAAMNPTFEKPDHKRSLVLDLTSFPKPLWAGPGRRRINGKQTHIEDVALPSQKRQSKPHNASIQSVVWTSPEIQELTTARDWRHRQRLEKQILHNRIAIELERHVLEPLMPNRVSSVVSVQRAWPSEISSNLFLKNVEVNRIVRIL